MRRYLYDLSKTSHTLRRLLLMMVMLTKIILVLFLVHELDYWLLRVYHLSSSPILFKKGKKAPSTPTHTFFMIYFSIIWYDIWFLWFGIFLYHCQMFIALSYLQWFSFMLYIPISSGDKNGGTCEANWLGSYIIIWNWSSVSRIILHVRCPYPFRRAFAVILIQS